MLTRQPRKGDTLEYLQRGGGWVPYGVVSRVQENLCWCEGQDAPFIWCFGAGGCLGFNVCFRISGTDSGRADTREAALDPMADPFF